MRERPPIRIGLLASAVMGAALVSMHVVLLRTVQGQPIGLNLALTGLLLILALGLAGLWLYGLIEVLSLRYLVDRNGVTIRTALLKQTIPHSAIRQVLYGDQTRIQGRFRGVIWPGYVRGRIEDPELGNIAVWSTEPIQRQLLLVTDQATYAISPRDRHRFVQGYEMRRNLGAIESLPHDLTPVSVARWSVWNDRSFWIGLAIALLLNVALATVVASRYEALPSIIPLHWNAAGQSDRLAPKSGLFVIPAIGTGVLIANAISGVLLHIRERFGAQLLIWASVGIQIALWAAAWLVLAS
jgi:hypothetical protein